MKQSLRRFATSATLHSRSTSNHPGIVGRADSDDATTLPEVLDVLAVALKRLLDDDLPDNSDGPVVRWSDEGSVYLEVRSREAKNLDVDISIIDGRIVLCVRR